MGRIQAAIENSLLQYIIMDNHDTIVYVDDDGSRRK